MKGNIMTSWNAIIAAGFLASATLVCGCSAAAGYRHLEKASDTIELYSGSEKDSGKPDTMPAGHDMMPLNAEHKGTCNENETGMPGSEETDPAVMNACIDSETGEMTAVDSIRHVDVYADFRTVAERNGYITLDFSIRIPENTFMSGWQMEFTPKIICGDTEKVLDRIFLTGTAFRERQQKEYSRYERHISRISFGRDSFLHRFTRKHDLETFFRRNLPEASIDSTGRIYGTPSGAFGADAHEALAHYTLKDKIRRNELLLDNLEKTFTETVSYPYHTENVMADTLVTDRGKESSYRFSYRIKAEKRIRKIDLVLQGRILEHGKRPYPMAENRKMTYYVSSLSDLTDTTKALRHGNTYARGIKALTEGDYTRALEYLRPHEDTNTAIALLSMGYDTTAADILERMESGPLRDYLLAIAYSRTGEKAKSLERLNSAIEAEPAFRHRANLDPELSCTE